jgi:hypothetical protein
LLVVAHCGGQSCDTVVTGLVGARGENDQAITTNYAFTFFATFLDRREKLHPQRHRPVCNRGAAIHPWPGTTSYGDVRVLNPGSADWSFKMLADSGGGGNVVDMEVSEDVEGSRKPIVVVSGQAAYSGSCE